jgi:23S rRNA pseudouridine2605 synthase
VRINKYLAACGLGSRRAVEDLVVTGRVKVDGERIESLSVQVTDDSEVEVDGKRVLSSEGVRVVLLHKPVNVMTTRDDPEGRATIYHLVPASFRRLVYAGRLDYASRGLVILTDDGELLYRLTHPRWDHPKRYIVELDAALSSPDLARIREGRIELVGELPLKPVAVEQRGRTLMMELREGRNRQIRRMMDALGRTVVDLCRVGVGQWTLDGLGSAEWRELGAAEIDPMRVALGLAPRGEAPVAPVAPLQRPVAPQSAPVAPRPAPVRQPTIRRDSRPPMPPRETRAPRGPRY